MRASGPPAIIAKFLAALASHSRAAFCSFDPKVASGTLFVFSSFYECDKILIIFVKAIVYAVLGTGHTVVVFALAFKAVMVAASWAFVVVQSLVKLECSAATCGRAPGSWGVVLFDEFVKWKLLKLFLQIGISILIDVSNFKMPSATLHRTFDIELTCLYFGFEVSSDALRVEDMAALE